MSSGRARPRSIGCAARRSSGRGRTPSWPSANSCSCARNIGWSPTPSNGMEREARAAGRGRGGLSARRRRRRPRSPPTIARAFTALASDLPRVWHDPRTPMRERKRMLRLLIEDVTLVRDRAIQIQIRWKGGATTTLERPLPLGAPDLRRTPAAIVEMIRALADGADRSADRRHAQRPVAPLRHRAAVPPPAGPALRQAYGIPSLAEHLRQRRLADRPGDRRPARGPSHHRQAFRARRRPPRAQRPTTEARSSSSRRPARCLAPTRASDSATAAAIPSVRRTYGRRCSMKPEPSSGPGRRGRGAARSPSSRRTALNVAFQITRPSPPGWQTVRGR